MRVQLFGDSIVGGYSGRPLRPLANGPVEMLQAAMDQRFGVGRVLVVNRAMPGTTSGDLRTGTDGLNKPWPQSRDADITLLNHGVNDMRAKVPLAAYRENLRAMPVTVLQTPTPVSSAHAYASPAYAQAMRETAVGPVADVDAYVRSLPNWERHFPDGVHPDRELYEQITAKVIVPALVPQVAKLRCAL